jgi:hypothetical protein
MNERIVKLISEADAYAWTIAEKYVPECGEVNYLWEDAFRKKFAELIVRECMSMSDELKAQYFTNRKGTMDFDEKNIYAEGEAACDTLRYKMKKHFGVEE